MTKEDYVSFKTAKHLKEKGFDWECRAFYVKSKECGIELFHAKEPYNYNNNVHPCTSAPTLQMAVKWLRKKYNIDTWVEGHNGRYKGNIHSEQRGLESLFYENSHEEACEAAIKYCLEILV